MSVVSLTEGPDDKILKEIRGSSRTAAVSLRKENDSRRIRQQYEDGHMPVSGRPMSAPFKQSNTGTGNLEKMSVMGPKQLELKKERNRNLMSKSTTALPKSGEEEERQEMSPSVPKEKRPSSSISPSRGRIGSPSRSSRVQFDVDDSVGGGSSAMNMTALEKRKAGHAMLSERDQAALKMGRLVLTTVMGNPDLSTEDSISRFFFDNWLAKSGSSVDQADSYSIELMTHLQAQIAQARADAPFLLNALPKQDAFEEYDEFGNEIKADDEAGEEQKERGQQSSPAGSPSKNAGMFKNLPKALITSLGEKVVHKTVGAVAMEALDRCILEFGKGNPILYDVKTSLIPLMFAIPEQFDDINAPLTANTPSELDGSKYLGYQTWLEDAQIMFETAQQAEKKEKHATAMYHSMEHEVKVLNIALRKEQARIKPILAEQDALRAARDDQSRLKEELATALEVMHADQATEASAKIELQNELKTAQEALAPKDNMIAELIGTIDQMKRDELPDIRAEFAASQEEIVHLKTENEELNLAIQNFKVMLASQKLLDEKSEVFLIKEGERVAEKMRMLNDVAVGDDLAGEGRVYSVQLSSDEKESERRLHEPLLEFFSNKSRALNGERYVEYLELKDVVARKENELKLETIQELRNDLQEAKNAVQRVIDAYEEKIATLKQKHHKEIADLVAKHAEQIEELRLQIASLNVKISEQKVEIDGLNEEVIRLNDQWRITRIELKRCKEDLEEALSDLTKALEKVKELTGQMDILAEELRVTKEELAETQEELKDTKEELAQCIVDLRETDQKLIFTKELLADRENELGMALNDELHESKFIRERALAKRLQAQLDFAKVEITNLKDNVEMLKHEIHDLHGEIASITLGREQDRKEFEEEEKRLQDIINELEISVAQKKSTISLLEARIAYLQAVYEEESMNAANAYHRAERHVGTLKGIIKELEQDVDNLTRERNDLIMVRENLKLELKKMEERAIEAENCTLGNQNMQVWFEEQLEVAIHTITKPKDPDAFDDDMGVSSVGLRKNLDSLPVDKFLGKVPDELKKKAIDVICRADANMRALADTFTDSIRNLEKSLAVSRDIIKKTEQLREDAHANSESLRAEGSGIPSDNNVSVKISNHDNIMGSPSRSPTRSSLAIMNTEPGQGSLEVLPDGWDMYNLSTHQLVKIEEWSNNKEMMQMMLNDDHEMHTAKDHILEHVMEIHGYHNTAGSAVDGAVESSDVLDMDDGSLAGSLEGSVITKETLQDEHTQRILRNAAMAVETENPLRKRVEEQHQEIIVLENTLADLKVEYAEMESELKGTVRESEKLVKAKTAIEIELETFKERFHQALLAVQEQEKEVIKVRKEAAEGFKKKQETAHPAVKMTMMAEAARGNPKKLVQPFLHFLRRNESDISRHLGQNIIAMREVRALCNRVKGAIDTLMEEQKQFYYNKHQSDNDTSKLITACHKIWDTLRVSRDDITECTSWVFEGQDLSLGNDKIRRALKINDEDSYLDPAKAIGDNHLAASYDVHGDKAAVGGTDDFPIEDDQKEDVKENAHSVSENLRCDSFRSGGWRMQLHNLDGSVDLDMPVNDWSKDDKISILDAQLQAAKDKIKAENLLALNRLDAMKTLKAESDRKYDDIKDEILALQKEYGAKGIEHDFMVYKRIKKGIIDGSLKKYNLPEVVYSPMDFEDIELGIYQAVQAIVDLCREDGEPERPPNPFPKSEGQVAFDDQEGKHGMAAGSLGAHLSSPVKKRSKSPKPWNEDLKAEEIGASGMVIHNMALSPIGRGGSAQGTRKPTVPVTFVSLPNTEKRSATAAPKSEWRENVEHKKRDKAIAKFRAENQPASFGAYSALKEIKRGAPDNSQFHHEPVHQEEVVEERGPAHDDEGMPLEWHNQKSQDLVNLLKTAVEKIQMRILFAKIIKPVEPIIKTPIRQSTTGSNVSLAEDGVRRLDTTTDLLNEATAGGVLKMSSLPPPDAQVLDSENINSDLHSIHSVQSMSQEDLQELFGDMDDTIGGTHQDTQQDQHSLRSGLDNESGIKAFAHMPVDASTQFAKEVFSNGAEPSNEEHLRTKDIANNDISRFVSKLNAKVNRHITSAKLFESIVSELESTRQNSGTLDMPTIKRICALRTSLPVGSGEDGNPEDMATIMAKLHLAKPPPSIARATHLVRSKFHHLVLEEEKGRKFVDGAWGGLPKFERGEPPELAHAAALEASTSIVQRSSLGTSTGIGTGRSIASREGTPFSASNSGVLLDPRNPTPSQFTVSTVSLAASGRAVGAKSKHFFKKKSMNPVLNISLIPTAQRELQSKEQSMEEYHRYQKYQSEVLAMQNQQLLEDDAGQFTENNEGIMIPGVYTPQKSQGTLDFDDSLAESSVIRLNQENGDHDDDMSYNSYHTNHSQTSLQRQPSGQGQLQALAVLPQDHVTDYAAAADAVRVSTPLDTQKLVPRPSSPQPPSTLEGK